jgi:hypothetical protein
VQEVEDGRQDLAREARKQQGINITCVSEQGLTILGGAFNKGT